jgi:hypothetical protein
MKATLLRSLCCLLSLCGYAAWCAQAGGAAGETSLPTQTRASDHWNIAVESWVKPVPGWLYVLDPKPDADGSGGRVWLLDPGTAKVMGGIRTGNNADFALGPDGSRLYVASLLQGDSSELAVIDTAKGVVVNRATIEYREVADVLPPFSNMAVSGDGLVLRILIDAPKSPDADSFLLAAYNTQSGKFLPKVVHLGNCGPGRFIVYPSAYQFDFLCPRTNRIRLISADDQSSELQNVDVKLPWERRIGAPEAIDSPAGQGIAIVRGDAGVFNMNVVTHEFTETPARPDFPNRIPPATWPTSPDGTRIYLGYIKDYDRSYDNRFYLDYGRPPNLRPNDAMAAEFHVLDTSNWRKIGTIKTKMPFWTALIANDGKTLYAMAPQKHSVLVIDTEKMRQTGVLKVGGAPCLALVAP